MIIEGSKCRPLKRDEEPQWLLFIPQIMCSRCWMHQSHDFYLVDFKTFDYRIEDMAALVKLALFQGEGNIWSTRTSQSEPFVILGASMGGVIGRLALAQAEQSGVNHHTRLFGSLDSPHKGAIIPLGLQAFVYFWSAYGAGAAEQLEQLHWQSVKQTLIRRQEGRFPSSRSSR